MPRVPAVARAPLPGPRVSPVAPAGAFGAPTPDYTPVLRAVAGIVEKHRNDADQLALLKADTELSKLQTDLHTQATRRQGLDALGASGDMQAAWEKGASDIEQSVRSERAKEAFRARRVARFQSLYAAVERHAADQYQRFAADTSKDALNQRFEEALANYTDPTAIETAVTETRAVVADQGAREGWSREMVAGEQAARTSRIHLGVIGRMLAKGDDIAATNYYARVQGQVLGSDAGRLEQELEIGSVRGTSQREADRITAQAATLDAALGQTKLITDPKVRDATEERVRRVYADRATNDRQVRFKAYEDAGVILEETRDVSRIPPATWNLLSVTERRALQEREDQIRHPRHASDPDTYWSLMNMAGVSDQSRHEFETVDLNKLRREGKLDDQDFHQLVGLQLALRRQTLGAVAGEARREATAEERDQKKAADRAAAIEQLKALGIEIKPTVPGGPITRPQAAGAPTGGPLPLSGKTDSGGKVDTTRRRAAVPQSWIDHAKRDPNYRRYLEHLGVVIP